MPCNISDPFNHHRIHRTPPRVLHTSRTPLLLNPIFPSSPTPKAYAAFSVSSPLHPDIWPSVNRFETEIVSMTKSLVDGGDPSICGAVTSGGTESIFLSCRAHKQWARVVKGVTCPEIVVPFSAHAAFDKACEVLDIRMVRVPLNEKSFTTNVRALQLAVTKNTIMIVQSAPSFPHGIIDDISAASAIAVKYGIGLHVDACLGGFILPFATSATSATSGGTSIAPWDFALRGVSAMSCDTHK